MKHANIAKNPREEDEDCKFYSNIYYTTLKSLILLPNFLNSKIFNQIMMKKLSFIIIALAALSFFAVDLNAQIRTPAPSPTATLSQQVGLTDVEIVYSRPSMKGRTIFAANGLVPFGKMWRTGANRATKITFSDDVKLGGKELKGGSYAILTIPTAASWTVNLYTYESGNWGSYREKTPALSLSAKVQALPMTVESFTIGLNDLKATSANLMMSWEKTMVAVSIETNTDKKAMESIANAMAGPSQNDYYQAASYYHDNKKDLKQALTWIQKANAEDPKFWQVRREALILADMGKYTEAIAAAKKSKDLATKAENEDYIRMNEKSIAEWTGKAGGLGKKSKKMK